MSHWAEIELLVWLLDNRNKASEFSYLKIDMMLTFIDAVKSSVTVLVMPLGLTERKWQFNSWELYSKEQRTLPEQVSLSFGCLSVRNKPTQPTVPGLCFAHLHPHTVNESDGITPEQTVINNTGRLGKKARRVQRSTLVSQRTQKNKNYIYSQCKAALRHCSALS